MTSFPAPSSYSFFLLGWRWSKRRNAEVSSFRVGCPGGTCEPASNWLDVFFLFFFFLTGSERPTLADWTEK